MYARLRFNASTGFVHGLRSAHHAWVDRFEHHLWQGVAAHIGPQAFTEWGMGKIRSQLPFTIGVVLIFLLWIAWNLPTATDVRWLREGGGIIGHEHPPARRFNAGQKLVAWAVVLLGGAMALSGYILMFPFYETGSISQMQTAQMVHSVAGVRPPIMLAHIYIGTIEEGAFEAMAAER